MKNSIFVLQKDGETAKIRFLYKSMDEVRLAAKNKSDNPLYACDPEELPKEFNHMYCILIPIYNEDQQCEQLWPRGITWYHRLEKIYELFEDVPSMVFQITRYGDLFDTHTKYNIVCLGKKS